MNNISKLMLSDEELQLVNNSEWILTKRNIIDKVKYLLGDLSAIQQQIIFAEKDWLPDAVVRSEVKIAKGENYLQLPYLILDYPRYFEGQNIFAVRTMFWWGNFFSITIQLSGLYKEMFQENIIDGLENIRQHEFYLCINESQWHHHFQKDNYKAINLFSQKEAEDIIRQKGFIKLAMQFPLQQWNDIPVMLEKYFREIIAMLKA